MRVFYRKLTQKHYVSPAAITTSNVRISSRKFYDDMRVISQLGRFSSWRTCSEPSSPYKIDSSGEHIDQEVLAATLLGLGLWRLRPIIRPKLAALAARIEGIIRQCCMGDALKVDYAGEFEYWDTLDPTGERDRCDPGFATSTPDPERGKPGYPRLQIENRVYTTRVFRKIHMEIAVRQDGLQVFHLLMYPKPEFDLPILNLSMVTNKDDVSLAIADTSPVRWNQSLPEVYAGAVQDLQSHFLIQRTRPQWGEEIFSSLCVSARPKTTLETNQFIQYACSLTRLHLEVSRLLAPVEFGESQQVQKVIACQQRFCETLLQNSKAHRVLTGAFGREKANRYMKKFMYNMPSLR